MNASPDAISLAHLAVDVCTLVIAVTSAFLVARRGNSNRLAKIENSLARIEGALRNSGFRF